jgi:tetratricopeptide (TPR) repeat protein
MSALPPPECHYLSAAIGWLELGNPTEAALELHGIAAEFVEHPAVLEVRWWLHADRREWEEALRVAQAFLRVAPDQVSGWIHQAYALRRIKGGGIEQAREALKPAAAKFPKEDIVPFNLACYAAQLGQLTEAWDWLHKAMEAAGDVARIKQRALADEDLKPLWDRIKAL